MKIKKVNAQDKRNINIFFDEEVNVKQAAEYVATLYKEASHNLSIKIADITGLLTHRLFEQPGDERNYSIVDDSKRCGLFNISGNMKFLRTDYWVNSYHAKPEETDILVGALEKACS